MVLPILILLLMGVVDFGRLFATRIALSSAAEAGAQYGAQSVATSNQTTAMQTAAIRDFTNAKFGSGLVANATVQCRCPITDAAMASCTATATCGVGTIYPRVYVQVQASKSVPFVFRYPGLPTSITLSRRAVVRAQ